EARARAVARLEAVFAYPHQVERTLRAANRVLPHTRGAHAPGADPAPREAEYWLREIRRELKAARRALHRHQTNARIWWRAAGALERRLTKQTREQAWDQAMEEARLALARHDVDREYAWDSKVFRTLRGWRFLMEPARRAAKRLYTRYPSVLRDVRLSLPYSPIIPRSDPVTDRQRNPDQTGLRPGLAAVTRRGRGNRSNQDGALVVITPGGDPVGMVADGVSSYPDSGDLVMLILYTFASQLDDGRTLGEAHAEARRLLRLRAGSSHGAAAYLAARVAGGTITLLGAGSARGVFLPSTGERTGRQLTVDHTRPGPITKGGVMTRWLGTDYQPEPQLFTEQVTEPGLLVLVTDGVWRYLPTPDELADVLTDEARANPELAAAQIAEAANVAGGVDDLTVTVIAVNQPGAAATASSGPTRPAGPTSPTAPTAPSAPTTPTASPASGAGAGGAVAIGGLSGWQRQLLPKALEILAPHLRQLDQLTDLMPRGPPPALVLDLDLDQARSELRAGGFTEAEAAEAVDALRRLVMFGWRDIPAAVLGAVFEALPEDLREAAAAHGAVVLTRAMLDELLDHHAAGRLTDAELEALWNALLGHEREFHLDGDEHTGPRHDADAARLANVVLALRALDALSRAGERLTQARQLLGSPAGDDPTVADALAAAEGQARRAELL
ncbi:MAG: hypothetical protein J2P20_17025, partial [Pseudonocardia sp.]|nr:hypothetical protein [Pseudonocardia sp.]